MDHIHARGPAKSIGNGGPAGVDVPYSAIHGLCLDRGILEAVDQDNG